MIDLDPASPARRHAGWRPTNAAFYARLDAIRERQLPPYRPQWLREEQRRAEEQRQAKAQVADKLSFDDSTQLVRLRADIAWMRFELAMLRLRRQATLQACGYNANQPRVPAGNPDGGQWTSDADLSTDISAARKFKGHHYLPRGVYEKRNLSPETRKVFEERTTGTLRDPQNNKWDRPHRLYNDAVDEHFDNFLNRHGISEEQMTPDHARMLLREVQESPDPRIRNYNMRLWLREILKRGPLRSRGNE